MWPMEAGVLKACGIDCWLCVDKPDALFQGALMGRQEIITDTQTIKKC